jgi:HAD superfamily hydrolase (TIGR01509 family)
VDEETLDALLEQSRRRRALVAGILVRPGDRTSNWSLRASPGRNGGAVTSRSQDSGGSRGAMIELVVFDCDGVMVDSEPISARVGAAVLADLGWNVTPEELIRRFAGCTDEYWRGSVESALGRPLDDDWDAPYQSWYAEAFDAELRAIPGVVGVLESLTVPFCVASNGSHEKIRRNLGRVGLLDAFDGRIFSAEDVRRGKPAPDLFLYAAHAMRVAPARCAVVEDSPTGLTAARAAGMQCLAYAAGLIPLDRLAGPATTVFDDMSQLPRLITSLGPRE